MIQKRYKHNAIIIGSYDTDEYARCVRKYYNILITEALMRNGLTRYEDRFVTSKKIF